MPLAVGSSSLKNKSSRRQLRPGWQAELQSDDHFMEDPKETDIIIPVIGITGVGKSTFINTLLGEDMAPVGHGLESHTDQIQHIITPHPFNPNVRLILIDTPGFDHTTVDDKEVFRRIAIWLARSYDAHMKLAGIVYLHEISQGNMPPVQKNLDLFSKICGPKAIKNVVLTTTKWEDVSDELGLRRETQLKDQYWKSMLEHGSKLHRFEGTKDSARSIIEHILSQTSIDAVRIQQELVDFGKVLAETEAGRSLRYTLNELLEQRKRTTARLWEEEGSSELQRKVIENDNKIRALVGQIKEINASFYRKVMRWIKY
ncbi:hypothetical protein D9615_003459 [Tricholomella constricta]|uniref:G domain-containing protein n=1 Tax=Tricholomella constricta TaxID=117010 RepID=A0A8H5HJ58_9AGAR|nr:hypothetical protein D9615_003459 [Tricholomella constricta]